MFSSLASFIFGSNTSATTNSEANNPQPLRERQQQRRENENLVRIDAENTINVTLSTPSVTGSTTAWDNATVRQAGKRNNNSNHNNQGSNKRNNKHNNRSRHQATQRGTPTITKLLTPNESSDEDLGEDWFIVEREESLPHTEEELSVAEGRGYNNSLAASTSQQRRHQHISAHSLYSGPRAQQQRNSLQRASTSSTLSPPRYAAGTAGTSAAPADVDCTAGAEFGANSMDESWFVTPPPCFTSIGPINMETSPYENLLIEHPSMSVYHSIRSAQEAAESFVNLDLGMGEASRPRRRPLGAAAVSVATPTEAPVVVRNAQTAAPQQPGAASARADRFTAAQLKQELFARSTQKSQKERQYLCRGAIKRSNKARDFQSRGNRQRRSDMQHCKLLSGANNNRKCCY